MRTSEHRLRYIFAHRLLDCIACLASLQNQRVGGERKNVKTNLVHANDRPNWLTNNRSLVSYARCLSRLTDSGPNSSLQPWPYFLPCPCGRRKRNANNMGVPSDVGAQLRIRQNCPTRQQLKYWTTSLFSENLSHKDVMSFREFKPIRSTYCPAQGNGLGEHIDGPQRYY
jgi:hypothetical protein